MRVDTNEPNTIVSSRKPDHLPAFCKQFTEVPQEQKARAGAPG